MFPNQQIRKSLKKQQGSMLVIALFVIIVLAFLAYAMIVITENSNRATVYEVFGARALHAANSGVDRAINEVLGPNVVLDPTVLNPCNNITKDDPGELENYRFGTGIGSTTGSSFTGCKISITCINFLVADTQFRHFRITSKANCSAGEFDTHRSVSVEARIIK